MSDYFEKEDNPKADRLQRELNVATAGLDELVHVTADLREQLRRANAVIDALTKVFLLSADRVI